MINKKFSLKHVFNQSIASTNGNIKKIFVSSVLQYLCFLIAFIITNSVLVSFVVWALFLIGQTYFLKNINNGAKLEDVFKLGRSSLTALLTAMIFISLSGIGFVLLIAPAIIFIANYSFVFEVSAENNNGVLSNFKKAQEIAKGYRLKAAAVTLIFLLILIFMLGFGVLVAFLINMIYSPIRVLLDGLFIGTSLYLIFAVPVQLMVSIKLKEEIENSKKALQIEQQDNKQDVKKEEPLEDRNSNDPIDLIF